MHLKSDDPFDRRSVMLMLASVILFAVNTLLVRAVALHVSAADGWMASFFRGVVGLAVVFLMYGAGRGLRASRLVMGKWVIIRGVVGALSIVAFYVTVVKLGAGRAVVLNLTYPMFATIIAALWLKETLTRAAVLWTVVGFLGLVLFLGMDGNLAGVSAYDWLALAGALGAGWVVVIIRRLRNEEHPATIYASQALYSMVLASPAAVHLGDLPMITWAGLAGGAVIVTFAQLVMTKAYQSMSVSRGSSLQMLLPLATSLGGFLCFGETFEPIELVGAMITLIATWRVVMSR
jgi:drug/metabolite transporter (DMT)-like permease